MGTSLYLVNPDSDCPNYYDADVAAARGLSRAIGIADLTPVTVAALAPADFQVEICENHVAPVDYDHGADFVAITGKVAQWATVRWPGAGHTSRVITSPDGDMVEDVVPGSAGSYSATATLDSGTWLVQLATFTAAP
jgi:hypothetical protein